MSSESLMEFSNSPALALSSHLVLALSTERNTRWFNVHRISVVDTQTNTQYERDRATMFVQCAYFLLTHSTVFFFSADSVQILWFQNWIIPRFEAFRYISTNLIMVYLMLNSLFFGIQFHPDSFYPRHSQREERKQ